MMLRPGLHALRMTPPATRETSTRSPATYVTLLTHPGDYVWQFQIALPPTRRPASHRTYCGPWQATLIVAERPGISRRCVCQKGQDRPGKPRRKGCQNVRRLVTTAR